jgi:hypothetical protein
MLHPKWGVDRISAISTPHGGIEFVEGDIPIPSGWRGMVVYQLRETTEDQIVELKMRKRREFAVEFFAV